MCCHDMSCHAHSHITIRKKGYGVGLGWSQQTARSLADRSSRLLREMKCIHQPPAGRSLCDPCPLRERSINDDNAIRAKQSRDPDTKLRPAQFAARMDGLRHTSSVRRHTLGHVDSRRVSLTALLPTEIK